MAFLFFCVLGFALSLMFDAAQGLLTGPLRPVGDVLTLLLCGALFVAGLFVLRAGEARLYHWLGMVSGAVLYFGGVRRAAANAFALIRRRAAKKSNSSPSQEGNSADVSK